MARLVNFRLTDDEIAALDDAAKAAGLSRPDWLRKAIANAHRIQGRAPVIAVPAAAVTDSAKPRRPAPPTVHPDATTCPHPKADRAVFSWGAWCKRCGSRP